MKKKKLITVLASLSFIFTVTAQEAERVADADLEPPAPVSEERVPENNIQPPIEISEKIEPEIPELQETKTSETNATENKEIETSENANPETPDFSENDDISSEISGSSEASESAELAEAEETPEVKKEVKTKAELDPDFEKHYPFIAAFADRPEVEAIRNDYLTPKRTALLYAILENAMEYRLYVRKTVTERELPGELEYLPVVESGYKTAAKSKSGATGMWQFMENSVKPFLKLTDYIDERLDPWKSTDAGLSKLQDNYRYFNDWLLAIAAYNCGAGAMNKAIKRGESRDFWYLAENGFISSQTVEYVPKLIAIADLAVNPEKYGIDLPSHDEEYEVLVNERDAIFDYIEVDKAYSISAIAREMRIDESTLKRLNPALIKGFTPPAAKYQIRLPLGMLDTAKTAMEAVSPIEFPFRYKVVAGDSLWSISRRYGVTVQMLCETNGIEENAILKIGKILYIPSK